MIEEWICNKCNYTNAISDKQCRNRTCKQTLAKQAVEVLREVNFKEE